MRLPSSSLRGLRRSPPETTVPSAPSDLGHPAVDEQLDAGDEAAVVGGEEHGGLGDLVGRRPSGPAGRCAARPALNCSASSSVEARPSRTGVSIGPGLRALTRILRPFRSAVQVRANDRTAALVAL